METPIFIEEHGDVTIYELISHAEECLEVIDVNNDEYTAYNGNGQRLELGVTLREKTSFFGKKKSVEIVKILGVDENPKDHKKLRDILIDFFRATNTYHENDDLSSLHSLVDKAVDKYGYTK